ncbi:MAG: sugar ABC transporter permease [Acidimicrobiales bacterium]
MKDEGHPSARDTELPSTQQLDLEREEAEQASKGSTEGVVLPDGKHPLTMDAEVAATDAALAGGSELIVNSLGEYLSAWVKRIRGGDSGILPVLSGLIVIVAIFQIQNHLFLSAGNLVNLLVQGAVFVLLGMAEVFVLLLGEIDLSVGYVAGVGAAITGILTASFGGSWPWYVAIAAGLAATVLIGTLQGTLVTRLHLPSFVVTLAGLLGWEGVMLFMIDHASPSSGGVIDVSNNIIYDLVNGDLSQIAGWVIMALVVGSFALMTVLRDHNRRSNGLAAPPSSLTALKVLIAAAVGVALVLVCNANRGVLVPLRGVPWVVLIVLAVLGAWSFLLGRTRFGRYVYAIGGNPEAARRAGINLTRIRTIAFAMTGLTAGMAGIIYESRLGSVSDSIDGGTLVLYAVASAVIGGTSLFGGRGKMIHAVLGGIIIATIYNGLGLLGVSAATEYIVTALVLLAAVTVDSMTRRGNRSTPSR